MIHVYIVLTAPIMWNHGPKWEGCFWYFKWSLMMVYCLKYSSMSAGVCVCVCRPGFFISSYSQEGLNPNCNRTLLLRASHRCIHTQTHTHIHTLHTSYQTHICPELQYVVSPVWTWAGSLLASGGGRDSSAINNTWLSTSLASQPVCLSVCPL